MEALIKTLSKLEVFDKGFSWVDAVVDYDVLAVILAAALVAAAAVHADNIIC